MDVDEVAEMIDNVSHDVTVAFIKYETNSFKDKMKEKGITEVHSAAAGAYLKWKTRLRQHDPVLKPEETGIPALRKFLFLLPARSNFINYRRHVFEVLPALRSKAECVVAKHVEDKSYAEMRQTLKQSIPVLEQKLKSLEVSQIDTLVLSPWNSTNHEDISRTIEHMIRQDWIHTKIHVAGFGKMLREHGMPATGKYKDRNLNDDINNQIKQHVERWHRKMKPKAGRLGESLDNQVQSLLKNISSCIRNSSADPALKVGAIEALEDASNRIQTELDTLLTELDTKLGENHLRFTTEIDIKCPIAKEMHPVYILAQSVQNGIGVYDRQRNSIVKAIVPDEQRPRLKLSHPLIKNLGNQLVHRQKELWKDCCSDFTREAMDQIQDFSDTVERLLVDEAYMTQEHRNAREQLKKLLVEFDKSLGALQDRFHDTASEPPAKRIKCSQSTNESSSSGVLSTFSRWFSA